MTMPMPTPMTMPSPTTSSLLAGLPSVSSQLLTPQFTSSGHSTSDPLPGRIVSEPTTRPSTTNLNSPPLSMFGSGSVSQPHLHPSSPTRAAAFAVVEEVARPTGWSWDVTPAEKTSSDRFFDMLDPWKHGYIEGDTAVPFMSKSKLPEADLAKIWWVPTVLEFLRCAHS